MRCGQTPNGAAGVRTHIENNVFEFERHGATRRGATRRGAARRGASGVRAPLDLQWFWLLINKPQSVTFQMRPTSCISSKWPKNSMQFTLGMPFLAVLGKFYRNLKGLNHPESHYWNCNPYVKSAWFEIVTEILVTKTDKMGFGVRMFL